MYRLVYLELEIKRAFTAFGHMLIGAITLMLLIGIIAFSATKLLYQDTVVQKMTVAVVQQEESNLSALALNTIESMESIQSICEFVFMEIEEAVEALEKRELFAILVLPEQLIEGIMNGKNTSAIVILPDNMGIEASVFKEVADAGAVMLGSAQAGIYAIDNYLMQHDMAGSVEEAEYILNKAYLGSALSREDYFSQIEVSVTGSLDTGEYYISYGIILFLLLCGISCASILKEDGAALRNKLRFSGIHNLEIVIAKVIAIALLLLFVLGLIGGIILVAIHIVTGKSAGISIFNILPLFLIILAAASMIVFIFKVSGNPVGGVMLLFITSIVMIFCSGGFVPSAFLPETIRKISPWLPTTILGNQAGGVLTGIYSLANTLKTIFIILIFSFLASIRWRKE